MQDDFSFLSFQFRHHLAHFAAGHHFHHFTGLVELFQQTVYFLNVRSATFGDTRRREPFKMAGLLRSSGVME